MWQCDYRHAQLREETLRPRSRTRLQAWRQHSGVTLPIITLRRLPPSLWSFSERNKRWWKFQKDKITNWKWQLSPPSFIRNRHVVSVPLWAHFHAHSLSFYRDQVSHFPTKPVRYIWNLCISRFQMHFIEIPAFVEFSTHSFCMPQKQNTHSRGFCRSRAVQVQLWACLDRL